MVLMLVPPLRRFHATSFYDAVTFFDFRAHTCQLLSAASLPLFPVWDRTCSMPTLSPRSYWSSLYATLSLTANSLLVLPRPLIGTVLPVAVLIAYVLSTMKVVHAGPDSPPWDLQLRWDSPSYALGASTNEPTPNGLVLRLAAQTIQPRTHISRAAPAHMYNMFPLCPMCRG